MLNIKMKGRSSTRDNLTNLVIVTEKNKEEEGARFVLFIAQ